MKEKVVENKKEEFKEYAKKIGALAHSYAQLDPQRLQPGNETLVSGGSPNEAGLVITNFSQAE